VITLRKLLRESITIDSIKKLATDLGIEATEDNKDFVKFLRNTTSKDTLGVLSNWELQRVLIALQNGSYVLKDKKVKFAPVPLDYEYGSVEPFIDADTMQKHYENNYIGYLDKLNFLVDIDKVKEKKIEDLVMNVSKYSPKTKFNAGAVLNHELFWQSICPNPEDLGDKANAIIMEQYDSFEKLQREFYEKAMDQVGSYWCWLVLDGKEIKIVTTKNQDNPLMNNKKLQIVLGLDMWEHAWIRKYNKKEDYITKFWNNANISRINELIKR